MAKKQPKSTKKNSKGEKMNDCGIYLIENKTTGQKYIGQSTKILERWKKHCSGQYDNKSRIDRAIQKYGIQNFSLKIITQLPNIQQILDAHEIYWIKFYNTYHDESHYNLTPGGGFSPMKIPTLREKMSKSIKKLWASPEYQVKNSISKSKSTNKTSNYYRVYKVQDPRYKQGFRYVYSYINENGNRKTISSVNINKLKQKVKKSNLLWIKF